MDGSGQALAQIVASVKKVTDIVSEIAAGTQEQSNGIAHVNREVMQMDQNTQQNAALVEQATSAGRAIVDQAEALNALVARHTVSTVAGQQGGSQARDAGASASAVRRALSAAA